MCGWKLCSHTSRQSARLSLMWLFFITLTYIQLLDRSRRITSPQIALQVPAQHERGKYRKRTGPLQHVLMELFTQLPLHRPVSTVYTGRRKHICLRALDMFAAAPLTSAGTCEKGKGGGAGSGTGRRSQLVQSPVSAQASLTLSRLQSAWLVTLCRLGWLLSGRSELAGTFTSSAAPGAGAHESPLSKTQLQLSTLDSRCREGDMQVISVQIQQQSRS